MSTLDVFTLLTPVPCTKSNPFYPRNLLEVLLFDRVSRIPRLQLDIIVHQSNLLAGLECRQSNVRAPVAPEGVPKRTVTAASNLALNSEIHLCQIIGTELHGIEGFVGRFALCGILGFDLLLHTAGAVFAGAASLSGFGATLRCCDC